MLYRLMRRPVFANGNAVMRKYKDGTQAHQCSHAYCRTHKIGKYEEGTAKRNEAAVQRNTVQCFAHSVFTHAKMNISAGSVIFGIITAGFHYCFIGRSKVGTAANKLRQLHGKFLQHFAACFTGRNAFNIIKYCFKVAAAYKHIAFNAFFKFLAEFRVNHFIICKQCFPCSLFFCTGCKFIVKMLAYGYRHIKALPNRPVSCFFGFGNAFGAKRFAVAGSVILFRAAVTDMGTYNNKARMFGISLGFFNGIFQSVDIFGIGNAQYLPAVCFKAFAYIFAESNFGIAFNGNMVVIIKINKFAQTQSTGQRCSFACNAFHLVAVAG